MTTLTRDEANRARESAWERYEAAQRDRDSWARMIAAVAVRYGDMPHRTAADGFIAARATAYEARADHNEARDRWQAVRS